MAPVDDGSTNHSCYMHLIKLFICTMCPQVTTLKYNFASVREDNPGALIARGLSSRTDAQTLQ